MDCFIAGAAAAAFESSSFSEGDDVAIKTVVLDFDGTCTNIPAMHQKFLDASNKFLAKTGWTTEKDWNRALDAVRAASPDAGWMLGGAPSAPAAADPFILSGEAVAFLAREKKLFPPYPDTYNAAYPSAIAPLRPELKKVLAAIHAAKIAIHFVSNASTQKVEGRLDDLLADAPALRKAIKIQGDAGKFNIAEPAWDAKTPLPKKMQKIFDAVPTGASEVGGLKRPIYLRRGSYFRALADIWGGDPAKMATTIVCGDIWELDLALPAYLGCQVHLIERGAPYDTCEYERKCLAAAMGSFSNDLHGLLERLNIKASA